MKLLNFLQKILKKKLKYEKNFKKIKHIKKRRFLLFIIQLLIIQYSFLLFNN